MGVLSELVKDILLEWATEKSEEMQASLLRHGHTDSAGAGNLYQSATISPEWITDEEGDALHLKIVLPFYAAYLNDGTRPSSKKPGRGFIDNLSGATSWISRKGINVQTTSFYTNLKTRKTVKRTFKNKAEANRSFAWAIATKRLKEGSVGSGWFDEVWGEMPVGENAAAFATLKTAITKAVGNAQFIVSIIDPNKPETKI